MKRSRGTSKKLCEEGMTCPYINEYQHQLEFTHSSSSIASKKPYMPFVGKGKVVGSGIGVYSENHTNKGRKLGGSNDFHHQRSENRTVSDDNIACGICGFEMSLTTLEKHMRDHELRAIPQQVSYATSNSSSSKCCTSALEKETAVIDLTLSPPTVQETKSSPNKNHAERIVNLDGNNLYCSFCDLVMSISDPCRHCRTDGICF
jgi:hypothetical protein